MEAEVEQREGIFGVRKRRGDEVGPLLGVTGRTGLRAPRPTFHPPQPSDDELFPTINDPDCTIHAIVTLYDTNCLCLRVFTG